MFTPALANTIRKNDIGRPGARGFGVGVCPRRQSGFSLTAGTLDPRSDNYGNYQFSDGSVMCWVPKFYYKIGTGSNGLSVNVVAIRGVYDYPTTAAANADGYALHRAFIDGGSEQPGFFFDKYICSKNAKGAGYVGSSIKNGLPISTNSAHNPIADLTACTTNAYWQTINAARARDGVDGAVNSSSIFHVASRFQYAALALLSLAHGQASSATTYCAWYGASNNFPKGCNNNALKDANDTAVVWESDGYSSCGKTGSAGYGGGAGNVFAKSTHNGQNCGVADLNGLMWEVSLGVTCIASGKSITAATKANPCQLTISSHGYGNGDVIMVRSVVGMTQLNDKMYSVTVVDTHNITIGVDSSAYSDYTSGGTATKGTWYAAKQATAMKDFTPGNSGATDHWGATGAAAMMDAISPAFALGGGVFAQRFGNGSNQVLSEATSGDSWRLSGLGFPKDSGGISTSGQTVFGQDYYYQYVVNELCLISCGGWGSSSTAGVWNAGWYDARAGSDGRVGFRAACYLV